ncbi:hypothetical protein ACIA74_22220 [Streptomyces sp. NPDC051658]|uniref:hypothetical protein n=1 Tax=Streptomyces sp. NPDC051658 TaxID=3365667 RepID=UPI0037B92614
MSTALRIKAFAACVAVLAVTATTTATATTADPDPLARFHGQHVDWHACTVGAGDELGQKLDAAGADCADITVPLDYADPGGRTITVAISRLKATDTAHRVGPLLLNDGGPAGPSLHMPLTKSEVMGEVDHALAAPSGAAAAVTCPARNNGAERASVRRFSRVWRVRTSRARFWAQQAVPSSGADGRPAVWRRTMSARAPRPSFLGREATWRRTSSATARACPVD